MIQILGNMGGGEGDTLNKELSAQSEGANLFTTPFGDKTIFRTKNGREVVMMFTFDPDMPYNSSYQMASITGDYMASIRRGMTKLLLDQDAKRPTKQETVWTHLKSQLSSSAFTEMLKQDSKRLHQYVDMLTSEAESDFEEEQKLTEAMMKQDYNYRFDIAIDAYPVKVKSGSNRGVPPGRKGVLSFFIQSFDSQVPAAVDSKDSTSMDTGSESKQAAGNAETKTKAKSEAKSTEAKDTTENGDSAPSKKRARTESSSSSSSEDQEGKRAEKKRRRGVSPPRAITRNTDSQNQWKKLSKRLKLRDDENWSLNYRKPFDTAYDFFEAGDKWFLGCIKTRAESIQNEKRGAHTSHLYH